MDYEVFRSQYVKMMKAEIEDNWLRGEIAEKIHEMFEEEKKEKGSSNVITKFLSDTGETLTAFNSYRWVFSKFKNKTIKKLPGLTWTHYRAAAGTENPEEWLTKAYDEGWNTSKLIEELRAAKIEDKIDNGLLCFNCNSSIKKENLVSISINKKRKILCSIPCAINYLSKNIVVPPQVIEEDPFFEVEKINIKEGIWNEI